MCLPEKQSSTSNLSRESREALASGAAMALSDNVNPTVQTNPRLGGSPPGTSSRSIYGTQLSKMSLHHQIFPDRGIIAALLLYGLSKTTTVETQRGMVQS